ncbi:GNAT family N-acetyltransferase [Amycolatopsis sp. NBC_01480]|jgi:RimJ/RimL family protein N-acetyltransferase|uniref:GNAT family N-acetyltransferase n=1 Tax=Amycolatopsis sp. NBC_01480 TaxID=2903562 RepID=UPI002E29FB38|nr:GNAT family N-acetyltransferase [Amycolatopsis sp. NBC_01480]
MDELRAEPLTGPRLSLEPLRPGHSDEMHPVLADPRLYAFTGGEPPTPHELRARYARQSVGRSGDGSQWWLNWVVRDTADGPAAGFVQATVGRDLASAEVAWLIDARWQGQGLAREAAALMLGWLDARGVTGVFAHIHPEHAASAAVARHLGLTPTGIVEDGEVRWERTVT